MNNTTDTAPDRFRDLAIGQTFMFLDYRDGASPETVRKIPGDQYVTLDRTDRNRYLVMNLNARVTARDPHPGPYCPCDMCQSRIP